MDDVRLRRPRHTVEPVAGMEPELRRRTTGALVVASIVTAFHLTLDDLYPSAREDIFEIAAGCAVATTWAVVAAWLLEAGMKRQERNNGPDQRSGHPDRGGSG